MNKSSVLSGFAGLATAGLIITLILANKTTSDPEEGELTALQDADPATSLIIQQNNANELAENPATRPPPLTVFFGPGQKELSQDNLDQIKDIADYLNETGETFEVRGCTDNVGPEDENYWLSYSRANNVLKALEQYNVPITRYMNEYDDQGNLINGQDRDVYGNGEDCPPLIDGEADTQEESRRADILLNPEY